MIYNYTNQVKSVKKIKSYFSEQSWYMLVDSWDIVSLIIHAVTLHLQGDV